MSQVTTGVDGALAIAFANTLVHDGSGGVADLFGDDEQVAAWVREQPGLPDVTASPALAADLRALRAAARALFKASLGSHPASRADARLALPDADDAVAVVTRAAEELGVRTTYEFHDGRLTARRLATTTDPGRLAVGLLAAAVQDFLTGPAVDELRACQAPRCVRYFVRHHGRQQWCKESCAARARAARFEERHRTAPQGGNRPR